PCGPSVRQFNCTFTAWHPETGGANESESERQAARRFFPSTPRSAPKMLQESFGHASITTTLHPYGPPYPGHPANDPTRPRHASITTTLDLYGHLYPGDLDKYADRLDDAAADATGKAKTRPDDNTDEDDAAGSGS